MQADVCSLSSSWEERMDLKGFATRAILLNSAIRAILAGSRWGAFGENRPVTTDKPATLWPHIEITHSFQTLQ